MDHPPAHQLNSIHFCYSSSQPPLDSLPVSPSQSTYPPSSQPLSTQNYPSSLSSSHEDTVDRLLATFVSDNLTTKQVTSIYKLSGSSFESSAACLLDGPTLSSIIKMIGKRFENFPRLKLSVDSDSMWADVVSQYKSPSMNFYTKLRITLDDQPAVDTGGVRRQVYTSVYCDFAFNKYIRLFDGPANQLRPACTAEARSSGLLKVLGSMISHSVCQDGIGFPYLSPTCYWYIVGGEERALEFISNEDLPADSAFVVSQVSVRVSWGSVYKTLDVNDKVSESANGEEGPPEKKRKKSIDKTYDSTFLGLPVSLRWWTPQKCS